MGHAALSRQWLQGGYRASDFNCLSARLLICLYCECDSGVCHLMLATVSTFNQPSPSLCHAGRLIRAAIRLRGRPTDLRFCVFPENDKGDFLCNGVCADFCRAGSRGESICCVTVCSVCVPRSRQKAQAFACEFLSGEWIYLIIFIYPLTVRIVGAPQTILQPVSSIFPCFPLPSETWQTPGLSIA